MNLVGDSEHRHIYRHTGAQIFCVRTSISNPSLGETIIEPRRLSVSIN